MTRLEILHILNDDGRSDFVCCDSEVEPILRELTRLALPLRDLRFDATANRFDATSPYNYFISEGGSWRGLADISTLEVLALPYTAFAATYHQNSLSTGLRVSERSVGRFNVSEGPLTWFLPGQNLHTLQIRDYEHDETTMQLPLRKLMTDSRYPKLSRIELLLDRRQQEYENLSIHSFDAMLAPGWIAEHFSRSSPHPYWSCELVVLHR
jgi:hypothetical protein